MKSTEHFKNTIEVYLRDRAETDTLFAVAFDKPNKSMDDCITYILNYVKASGCIGFSDEEIYSLAIHFWDEDDINIGSLISCNIVVNHAIELTEEEKQQARQNAIKKLEEEEYAKINQVKKRPTINQDIIIQKRLFDL